MPGVTRIFALGLVLAFLTGCVTAQSKVPPPQVDKAQILVVMTNHSEYPTRSDSTGLWLTELTHFTDIVEAAGYETVFTSPQGSEIPLDERSLGWLYMDDAAREHLASDAFRQRLKNTHPIAEIDPGKYAAIYFTGGHGVMWDFRNNADLINAAETIYAQGGVVSAVCHGIAGLVDLEDDQGQPLIKGRRITGFSNVEEWFSGLTDEVPFLLQDELEKKGADYEKAFLPFYPYAVTDGRIVTGQNPSSAKAVARSVLVALASNP